MGETGEPIFIQALIPKSAIERFHVRVLVRLAWFDQSQRDAITVGPRQHRFTGELRSVVRAYHCRLASQGADLVHDAGQVIATNGVLWHDRNGFVGGIVDNVKHFTVRPDAIRSNTKSIDQISFALPGRTSG